MPDSLGDLVTPRATSRCPSCTATLRAGAPWCTLCYADLRTPGPGLPAAAGPPPGPTADSTTGPAWPCTSCGANNPLTLTACAGCGAGFLSTLRAAEGPLLELPVVGDLGALSRAQRLGLAAGVVGAVLVLVLVFGLLFG